VPRITDCCICTYVFGCKLSLFRLCDSDFGITPVDDITNRITCAAFFFHTAHVSFASSWYLFCLSVIVLGRLRVFGTAMSIKKVFFVYYYQGFFSGGTRNPKHFVNLTGESKNFKCWNELQHRPRHRDRAKSLYIPKPFGCAHVSL
jgi:hypothetical protein